jgi:cysteinyl-tRNA synthetase
VQLLDLEGAKMSKSLGNVVRLRDALEKVDAEALRYFFLSTHYRQQLAFTDKSLADAEARMGYFYETLKKVDERIAGKDFGTGALHGDPQRFLAEFDEHVSDDFNFPGGLGALAGLFSELNLLTDPKSPVKDKAVVGRTLVALREVARKIAGALGLFETEPGEWLLRHRDRLVVARGIDAKKVQEMVAARDAARAAKNYLESDRIRAEAKAMGVELMDSPAGTTWKIAA